MTISVHVESQLAACTSSRRIAVKDRETAHDPSGWLAAFMVKCPVCHGYRQTTQQQSSASAFDTVAQLRAQNQALRDVLAESLLPPTFQVAFWPLHDSHEQAQRERLDVSS
jgi:hypothetical protein